MKQNFEFELDDYFDADVEQDTEVHFKNARRRRSHDARRQIENLMDKRRLRSQIDPFDESWGRI